MAEGDVDHVSATVGAPAGPGPLSAEDELRFQKSLLESQSEASIDGILVVDGEGRMVSFNRRFVEMWGIPEDVVASRSDQAAQAFVLHKLVDPDGFVQRIRHLYGRPQERSRDEIRLEDGRIFDRYSAPVTGEDGTHYGRVWFFRDVTDQRRQEDANRFLAEAGEVLSSSLDYETTLGKVARLLVPRVADVAVMYLVEEGRPRRIEFAHFDPDKERHLRELADRYPTDYSRPNPLIQSIESAEPILLSEIPDALLENAAQGAEHLEALRGLGLTSAIIVPLVARGGTLGAIVLCQAESGRRYDRDDLILVAELGRRAAAAVDNARLHDAEREARREAVETAVRVSRLQAVTAALSEALTRDRVAEVLIEHVLEALGAQAGALVLLDESGTTLEVVRAAGYPEDLLEPWRRIRVNAPLPLAEAVRTGTPLFIESVEDLEARHPDAAASRILPDGGAWAAVPLGTEGRVVGAIGLTFTSSRRFTETDRAFVLALAQQCGQALERARLYEAEREAREQALDARERLNFLAEATEILASSLDYRKTVAKFADLCIPRLADWVIVDVLEEGPTIRQLAVAHVESEKAELARELRRKYPPDWPDHPIARVLRTGSSEIAPQIDLRELERSAANEEHLEMLRDLGISSHMIVPLVARGRVFGAVSFVSGRSGRRYAHSDLALAEELVRRAGLALDNARLYEERSRVARMLQQSLLPRSLPEIPGLEVAARYHAAGEGNEVGGDFYDLFQLGERDSALVIGDVCGKGAEAAALTGLARHTIRMASRYERDPAAVLRALNAAILREGMGRFCTVSYGRLDLSSEPATLSVVCGGHPAPMVLRSGGTVETVGALGTLLGAFPDPSLEVRTAEIHPGDVVLFYTDGVVEEGRVGALPGEQRLQELLRLCGGLDAPLIADRIERHAAEFRIGPPRDDIAVLVVRRRP